MNKIKLILFVIVLFNFQSSKTLKEGVLSKNEKKEVVASVGRLLEDIYVFPEIGKKMNALLNKNLELGKYDSITDPNVFSQTLTEHLFTISNDKHLGVTLIPELKEMSSKTFATDDMEQAMKERLDKLGGNNYGFKEFKILEGNIGYLDLRIFHYPKWAKKAAVEAMSFFSEANALIIDLRNNGGGSGEMVRFISSYLFEGTPIHLNSFYSRRGNSFSESWTLSSVPGKQLPDIDVYILTSNRTFSAAEEFTYNLKHLKRATIIGEKTRGGAHPVSPQKATNRFEVWIPWGRSINPITKTNWEAVGVIPDINIESDKALAKALNIIAKNK